jgi:hypothetical protein
MLVTTELQECITDIRALQECIAYVHERTEMRDMLKLASLRRNLRNAEMDELRHSERYSRNVRPTSIPCAIKNVP